jgi:hypothetical protein
LLRNLTKYEINLQNQTLFLAKSSLYLFDVGIVGNKFRKILTEVFMEIEKKPETGTHGLQTSTCGAAKKADRATQAGLGLRSRLSLSFDARPYIPQKNLHYQEDRAFYEPERHLYYDIHFWRMIGHALHVREGISRASSPSSSPTPSPSTMCLSPSTRMSSSL